MASRNCGSREVTGSPLPPEVVFPEAGLVSLTARHGALWARPAASLPCFVSHTSHPAVLPTHWEV